MGKNGKCDVEACYPPEAYGGSGGLCPYSVHDRELRWAFIRKVYVRVRGDAADGDRRRGRGGEPHRPSPSRPSSSPAPRPP
ncbi:hypothetical protein GUJ93_ZPchr0013g36433 [Zizania palustris]|uniref:Uncharacterized protein n=1 Tax=Zizania palustris TaxID=103762 RepID=A0A8J5WZG5_ZIZPA|nr:hypothetical protein GUJ93_ZPchr0013g37294 [Zizania palustris]KAG8098559.1 hypothetical protein GUJ93_ZPchr0013g36433 [Zizania palustris]